MIYELLLISTFLGLNYAYTCCITQENADDCNAEGGGVCTWLDASDPLFDYGNLSAPAAGIQCVSDKWYDCETGGSCPPPPPNPPPPPECVFDTCEVVDEAFNVAFIIDESGSVGYSNYLISLDFVENMVTYDINDVSTISMLAFGTNNDRMYSFSDSQNDQKQGAIDAITEERNDYDYGWTCANKALREMVSEFRAAETNGDLVDGKNIAIFLTDGYPNCGEDVCDEVNDIMDVVDEFYIVGVTNGFSAKAVECLTNWQGPTVDYIFKTKDFDPKLFWRIEARLRNVVCPRVFMEGMESISQKFQQLITDQLYQYGYDHGQIIFWFSILLFIIAAFIYQRKRICSIKGKDIQPLMDGVQVETY